MATTTTPPPDHHHLNNHTTTTVRYGESVITDLKSIFDESTTQVPMVCFLSLGSDPTQSIMDLAKEFKLDCRDISMGQGQEVHARKLVTDFQETGGWVLLQNCHLALEFMPELQASVQDAEKCHPDFRLWITTEEAPKFPINLLQASLKFTNEPPQGVKAGLKRTFAGITQDKLDISIFPQWKPMLFGVCVLHSVVQERRKFGPLGWNIPYEFNAGDLLASTQMVQNAMDDFDPHKGVVWTAIRCVKHTHTHTHTHQNLLASRDAPLLCTPFLNHVPFLAHSQVPLGRGAVRWSCHG
jgi:dynein heavy chain